MGKRLFSWILTVCMLLTMLPTMAWAEDPVGCTHVHDAACGYVAAVAEVPCTVEGCEHNGAEGCGYVAAVPGSPCTHVHDASCVPDGKLDIANGSIVITATGYTQGGAADEIIYTGDYVISQADAATATANTITVNGIAAGKTITLDGVNISAGNPIKVSADTTLILNGTNTLKSTSYAIDSSGKTLTIQGTNDDKLNITSWGGAKNPAIYCSSGNLNIEGGYIAINCKNDASAIGGGKSMSMPKTITISGGVLDLTSRRSGIEARNPSSVVITGGTLKKVKFYLDKGKIKITSVTGGNVSGSNITSEEIGGRKRAQIYFAGADANTLVSIQENGANGWSAYCDENGMVTTYLADITTVSFTAAVGGETKTVSKASDGKFIVGEECTCSPTAFDWGTTASTAKVYSTEVTIPVTVDVNKCSMPFHKIGAVTWTVTGGADKATANGDGTLTLKHAASDYDVTLTAYLAGYDGSPLANAEKIIKVTADQDIHSLNIGNGIVVVEAGTDGKTKYTQYSGTSKTVLDSFEVGATDKVYIFGTYSGAATPIINLTGGTPNIVLSDLNIKNTIKNTNNTYALNVEADVEASISLEGSNSIYGLKNRNSIQVASGAKLTIDSAVDSTNGTGLASVVDQFKTDHNVDITQSKYVGTLNTGTFTGGGDVTIKGGNISSNVNGFAFNSLGNLTITGGNIYALVYRQPGVWANTLTITGGTVYAREKDASTTYRAVVSGKTITLGTEGDKTNSNQLYIYANSGGGNGAAIGGRFDCTINIHSGVIIADASGNGNAMAIGIGNSSAYDLDPEANITITGGDIWAIGPEPQMVDNGDGTSRISNLTTVIGSGGNNQSNSGGVNGQGVISITGGTISSNGNIGFGLCAQDRKAVNNGELDPETLFAGCSVTISGDAAVVKTSDLDYTPITSGYYDTTISGDATLAGIELPDGVDSLSFSSIKAGQLKADSETGTVTVPDGTVMKNTDGTTTVYPNGASVADDGTVAAKGAAITENADGSVNITDKDGNTTTITPAKGESVTVNTDGTVEVPAGSTVNGATLPEGTGTVILPVDKVDEIKTDAATGAVTLPAGSVVENTDGTTTTYPDGGSVAKDGTVATEGAVITKNTDGSVTITDKDANKTTITPAGGKKVTVNSDGTVRVPAGSTITDAEGNEVTLPAGVGNVTIPADKMDEVKVDADKGTISVPGGSTINGVTLPENTGTVTLPVDKVGEVKVDTKKGTITVPGGSTINGVTLPENMGTVTFPADKVDEIESDPATGTATLPAGTVVKNADGTTTTLPDGGSLGVDSTTGDVEIKSEGTVITGNTDGSVTITDKDGNTTTITPAEGEKVTVSSDGTVKVPAGSTITDAEGKTVTLPEGTGTMALPADKVDEIKADDTTGAVSMPAGTVVESTDGTTTTLPDGGSLSKDSTTGGVEIKSEGTVITENPNGSVTIIDKDGNTTTITPAEGESVTVNPDGTVEVSEGSAVNGATLPEGTGNVTIPADKMDEVKVDKGTISVPGGSTINGVTLPENMGTVTLPVDKLDEVKPGSNGSVQLPAGSSITDENGKTTDLVSGGTVGADGVLKKKKPSGSYTPPVNADVDNSSLNSAAQAVGKAIISGNAELQPVGGYTMADIVKLQKEGKLNISIEKKAGYASVTDKNLIDNAIAKAGGGTNVVYFEISVTLTRSDTGATVAIVSDTEKALTITLDLSADLQKAAKEGKYISLVRVHNGKVSFIDGKLNADKTKITFSTAKFSTYAVVAMEKKVSADTFDSGIMLYGAMALLSVAAGTALVIGKKRRRAE